MRILIGYDGSRSADSALDDLEKAGLPGNAEVSIVSVAEIWMPLPGKNNGGGSGYLSEINPEWIKRHREAAEAAVCEAETLSRHARLRLNKKFPSWKISARATYGSPARAILSKAEEIQPDLIVVGSQGKNAISRILLGSISNRILREARCSVRVARGKIEVDHSPVRIMIGFDGSPGAKAAIDAVAARRWGNGGEARLVTANDSFVPAAIGRFIPPVAAWVEEERETEEHWMETIAESALQKLRKAGLKAALDVKDGNPKQILVDEAAKWSADCIFVGANSFDNRFEKFLIGSTSAAVAERATCSVEVVRRFKPEDD